MTHHIFSIRRWGLAVMLGACAASFLPLSAAHAQVRGLPDFTDLVDQVGPSVVNIRTLEKVSARAQQGGPNEEEMLEFFRRFGLPIPNMPKQNPRQNRPQQQEEEQPRGVGSGFILTSDGVIMTNAHVVDGADEVIVTLTDKREFKAKTIGADKNYDTRGFVAQMRHIGVTPHVAQNTSRPGGSAIDGRTTRHQGYAKSIHARRGIEKVFGWIKQWGGLRQFKLRGTGKVSAVFGLHVIAYNLIRLGNLLNPVMAAA